MSGRAAVFFDRDGTVCHEVGYINHPERLVLAAGSAAALRRLNERGVPVVLATNQAGAARGYFPFDLIDRTHRRLQDMLAAEGAHLDGIYFCPHHPDVGPPGLRAACNCRKPRPGMLLQAARELDLDLARSFMVGDTFRDVGAGRAAGVGATVMLRTGYGRGELVWKSARTSVWPDHVADTLPDAVDWIVHAMEGPTP